jgi:small subunit ribosomal protein S1
MADLKNVAPLADFDWEAYEQGDNNANESREAQTEAYEGSLNKVSDHDVVDGTIISINKREVVVNIGFKSDGIIPTSEFRYNPELKVGDTVEVYIENQEDKKGQLILSHKKARASRSWDRVNEALNNDEIIKGYVKCRTKGGMIVDVFGIEAFLPGSQIDVKPIRDYDIFVGKTMEFKVVKSTRTTAMSLLATRLSSKLSWKHRRRKSSASSKRVRFSKELLRTSPTTVCSLTSVALTVLSTSQTSAGVVLAIRRKSLSSTRRSMLLFSTSTTRRSALLSA